MSAQASTTGAPPWSRRVWADSTSIYVEVPCTGSVPFIQRYSKTEGGLSKALELICLAFLQTAPKPGSSTYKLPTHPKTKGPKGKPVEEFTQEQRDATAAVLKKLGIT